MASVQSRLYGAWELLSATATNVDNPDDITYPQGKDCRGQLMYTHDGYMSVTIQWGEIKAYEAGWTQGTSDELAKVAQKTMAYCGPFYLEEDSNAANKAAAFHHIRLGIPPNWITTFQFRSVELTEENGRTYLTLRPKDPQEENGVRRLVRLNWRKLPENVPTNLPTEIQNRG